MSNEANEFLELFKGALGFVEKEEGKLTKFKVTNIEHKRSFWNNISNLTAAEIAAVILLLTSGVSLNTVFASVSFLSLIIELCLIQFYIFFLLFFEGRDIDKMEKTFKKLHDFFNDEFEKVASDSTITLEDFKSQLSEKNKEFWQRELKTHWIIKTIKKIVASDLTPILLLTLFIAASIFLIISVDIIRCQLLRILQQFI